MKIQIMDLFLTCSDVTYDKAITPYIHVFIYHWAAFAKKYRPLKVFEMEAVEQLNYVNKLVFFGASNHGKENFSVTEQVKFFCYSPTYFILKGQITDTCKLISFVLYVDFKDNETLNEISSCQFSRFKEALCNFDIRRG